jgi:hypothetical protein
LQPALAPLEKIAQQVPDISELPVAMARIS